MAFVLVFGLLDCAMFVLFVVFDFVCCLVVVVVTFVY